MKQVVVFLLCGLFIGSCDQLEEVDQLPTPTELDGKWALQNARCFCFFPDDFDFSAHQLEFDSGSREVRIENSEDTSFVAATGTYSLEIQEDRLVIGTDLVYTYRIEERTLILTFVDDPQLADDEISLIYSKL